MKVLAINSSPPATRNKAHHNLLNPVSKGSFVHSYRRSYFAAKIPLTHKILLTYTPSTKKEVLINASPIHWTN